MEENRNIAAKILFILYACLLTGIAMFFAARGYVLEIPAWELQSTKYLVTWFLVLLLKLSGIVAAFLKIWPFLHLAHLGSTGAKVTRFSETETG